MEILLLQTIEKLGEAGTVRKVSDGYARNYLIPRHFAIPAVEGVVAMAKTLAENRQAEEHEILEEAKALKERLESMTCSISVKVGRNDQLFGSVTHQDIAKVLEEAGVTIDRRRILLDGPIKHLGDFSAVVKLHPQVEASLKVSVVRK
ncbi:MAG: 50S ribosomal protein L9 [Chlamydiae bacterium]|nr:50S ribosomal protein L9 [Chlamydiota bacterium]MBI3277551.1 50S ribosomal protein L9 [Chlamydiota bacterium]